MSTVRTVHVRVEGRVQGVGYRAWVLDTARAMGLTGWVRNRHDRSVEMVLQGPAEAIGDMLRRLEQGPPDERVTRVEVPGDVLGDVPGEGVGADARFEVRPTA